MNILIISVVPGGAKEAGKMQKASRVEFTVAADADGKVMDYLGLRHKNGNPLKGEDVPQSASFLFDRSGKLIWSKIAENYRVRPRPEEILETARKYFKAVD